MPLVDKKGKLFGKINLIDFLIVVIIIAVVAALGLKFVLPNMLNPVADQEYEIQFFIEEAPDFVKPYIMEQDVLVKDFDKALTLGRVLNTTTDKSINYTVNSEGQSVQTSKPNYISAMITARGSGTYTDENGLVLGGVTYPVGRSLTLIVGKSAVYGRIYAITPVNPE